MEKYIHIKKSSLYLEDRDGIQRVTRLFCFLKRFANECNADTHEEDENLEEVYLNGFFEISANDVQDCFTYLLMEEESNPKLRLVAGTINGKEIDDCNRIFTTNVNNNEIYVKQTDIDKVANYFGIKRNNKFNDHYFMTIEDAKKYYEENLLVIFYPDEEDEFMEYYASEEDLVKKTKSGEVDMRSTRFAKLREDVLGAALSCLANSYKNLLNNSGKVEARKIQETIYMNSELFWDGNYIPMKSEGMERLISKWINHNGKDSVKNTP